MNQVSFKPEQVLDFWFPNDGYGDSIETLHAFFDVRMHGGMDEIICRDFAELTEAAAKGQLDHWADTPRGRLALLITLDQFPRSLWRDTLSAFGQDIKSTRLCLEGITNGDFDELSSWEQAFFVIAISHCEGPDHLERMKLCKEIVAKIVSELPESFVEIGAGFIAQNERVTGIIQAFGRHPHRNPIYGRVSTPEEESYLERGDFPHLRKAQ